MKPHTALESQSQKLVIELPGEPRGKQRPRFVIGNKNRPHVYTPPETVKYERDLGWMAKAVMGGRPPLEGPLRVSITAVISHARRFKVDADNIGKIALDALNGIVFNDDRQVLDLRVRKMFDRDAKLRIEIE